MASLLFSCDGVNFFGSDNYHDLSWIWYCDRDDYQTMVDNGRNAFYLEKTPKFEGDDLEKAMSEFASAMLTSKKGVLVVISELIPNDSILFCRVACKSCRVVPVIVQAEEDAESGELIQVPLDKWFEKMKSKEGGIEKQLKKIVSNSVDFYPGWYFLTGFERLVRSEYLKLRKSNTSGDDLNAMMASFTRNANMFLDGLSLDKIAFQAAKMCAVTAMLTEQMVGRDVLPVHFIPLITL